MNNLDIIKYLANNNPSRLAEFLDDIYCNAWNCGSFAGSSGEGKMLEECEMEFSESKWLEQEVNTDFFFDSELEEWSKAIHPVDTLEVFYGDKSKVIDQAIGEIKLLETITESDKYSSEIYDIFRKEVCTKCSDSNCLRSQAEIYDCYKF